MPTCSATGPPISLLIFTHLLKESSMKASKSSVHSGMGVGARAGVGVENEPAGDWSAEASVCWRAGMFPVGS